MTGVWLEGFGLGIATGPYCFTACAPLLVPYLMAEGRQVWKGNFLLLLEFMAGRLAAYLLIGAMAGLVGTRFSGQLPQGLLSAAILVSGVLMLLVAAMKLMPRQNSGENRAARFWSAAPLALCHWASGSRWVRRIPFVLGFVVGVNLCPPFVAGLMRVLQQGHPGWGAAYFAAFFVGTSLYLLPVMALVPVVFQKRASFVGSLACALTGLWFTVLGAAGLLR